MRTSLDKKSSVVLVVLLSKIGIDYFYIYFQGFRLLAIFFVLNVVQIIKLLYLIGLKFGGIKPHRVVSACVLN